MDPLSITASILTILGTLTVSLDAAIGFCTAPHELRELAVELRLLCAAAEDLAGVLRSQASQVACLKTVKLLRPIYAKIQDCQRLFTEKLVKKPATSETNISFARLVWITQRHKIKRLIKDIISIRDALFTVIQVVNLSSTSWLNRQCHEIARRQTLIAERLISMSSNEQIGGQHHIHHFAGPPPVLQRSRLEPGDADLEDVVKAFDEFLDVATNVSQCLNNTFDSEFRRPAFSLERSGSFYPEKYTTASRLPQHSCVVFDMVEVYNTGKFRIDRYAALFAVDERHWKRLVINVMIPSTFKCSRLSGHYSKFPNVKILPEFLRLSMVETSRKHNLPNMITRINVEVATESMPHSTTNTTVHRLLGSYYDSDNAELLQSVRGLTSPQTPYYVESEVVLLVRYASLFVVQVQGEIYVEKKLPFSLGVAAIDIPSKVILRQLQAIYRAQGCGGVAGFGGFVLADDRSCLISYLIKAPLQGPIFAHMQARNQHHSPISWERRERWIHQAINTTKTLHERGIVIGWRAFASNEFWLDSSDDIKVVSWDLDPTTIANQSGRMPPEMREMTPPGQDFADPDYTLTFETDLFQLGLLIWQFAQNLTWDEAKRLYHQGPCDIWPEYCQIPAHFNPIELPLIQMPDLPAYVNLVIHHCRQEQPSRRIPAAELIKLMSPLPCKNNRPPTSHMRPIDVSRDCGLSPGLTTCDHCYRNTLEEHYHCRHCHLGNYDLCPQCFMCGVGCLDRTHVLERRVWRNGQLVNEPLNGSA